MSPDPAARVALVTGAARGIGRATVTALAHDGFAVAGLDLGPPDGATDAVWWEQVDVSVADEVDAATARILERAGRADALVNCAGILDVHAVEDTPEETWDRVMAVNAKSVYLLSRAVIPAMRAGGGGSIVNVASVHALATVPRAAAYAASKGAVLSLSRQMALDLYDDGIRVNAVVVGSVDTEMSAEHGRRLAQDGVRVAAPSGAIGRQAAPAEVADAIAYLCSQRAAFVTGSPFVVDGGMLARLL